MKVKMFALSDIGNTRKNNEDAYIISEADQFAVVCDGMGGHQGGQEASRLACETIRDITLANRTEVIEEITDNMNHDLPLQAARLACGLRIANSRVFMEAQKKSELKGMGTTATAAIFAEGQVFIGHIGDTRVYRIRNDRIQRLTDDHTWLNELLQDKEIAEDQVKNFEQKNVITRAIGLGPKIKVDISTDTVTEGDVYLICSDGLTDSLKDETIQQIIGSDGDIERSAADLIAKAKELKGTDNITAVLVTIHQAEEVNPDVSSRNIVLPEQDEKMYILEKKAIKQIYSGKRTVTEKGNVVITVKNSKHRLLFEIIGTILMLSIIFLFAAKLHLAKQEIRRIHQSVKKQTTEEKNSTSVSALTNPGTLAMANANKTILAVLHYDNLNQFYQHIYGMESCVRDTFTVPISKLHSYQKIDFIIRDSLDKIIYTNNSTLAKSFNLHNSIKKAGFNNNASGQMHPNAARLLPGKNNGTIYLTGFEKEKKYLGTILLLNEKPIGKLEDFLISGLRVVPGTYKISIQDTLGRLIQSREDITILPGGVKLIEAD